MNEQPPCLSRIRYYSKCRVRRVDDLTLRHITYGPLVHGGQPGVLLPVSVGTLDKMDPSILRRGHRIDDGNCKRCLRVELDFGLVRKNWNL